MKLQEMMPYPGRIPAAVLLLVLLVSAFPVPVLPAIQADSAASVEKMKSIAESQHEIVVLLIKKQEYEKAATEADKIFDMKWPADQEPLLLKELLNLTGAFLQRGQAPISLRLIEKNSGHFKKSSSQASLFKEMGYLHKVLKQDDQAIECFKKARDLEGEN
jgi:tetratricopeptide (TPR) repeat protein